MNMQFLAEGFLKDLERIKMEVEDWREQIVDKKGVGKWSAVEVSLLAKGMLAEFKVKLMEFEEAVKEYGLDEKKNLEFYRNWLGEWMVLLSS